MCGHLQLNQDSYVSPDLAVGVEFYKIRQLQASEVDGTVNDRTVQVNAPTLPGYSQTEIQSFQMSDPTLLLLKGFWNQGRRPTRQERRFLSKTVNSLVKQWPQLRKMDCYTE